MTRDRLRLLEEIGRHLGQTAKISHSPFLMIPMAPPLPPSATCTPSCTTVACARPSRCGPYPARTRRSMGGDTCAEPEYRAWVVKLQSLGFEIGYHMTSYHSSLREETRAGLEQFAYVFGQYPATMANHVGCTENIPTATLLE